MLDKKELKEKLESERDILLEELRDMGRLDPMTGEWEATPDERTAPESDENDKADRFEDYESRSSMLRTLEPRLNLIIRALKNLDKETFGKCKICNRDIEPDRLEANPAAQTCKEHLEE